MATQPFTLPPIAIDWSPVTTAPSSGKTTTNGNPFVLHRLLQREFDPITIARLVVVKPAPVLVSAFASLPITTLSSLKVEHHYR